MSRLLSVFLLLIGATALWGRELPLRRYLSVPEGEVRDTVLRLPLPEGRWGRVTVEVRVQAPDGWSLTAGDVNVAVGPLQYAYDPDVEPALTVDGVEVSYGVTRRYNSVQIDIDTLQAVVSAGGTAMTEVRRQGRSSPLPDTVAVCIPGRGRIAYAVAECYPDHAAALAPVPLEDAEIWHFLDREHNPATARPGGVYTLALLRREDGTVELRYVSGAEVNARAWRPGMLKGVMHPTAFEGTYRLTWYDAMMVPVAGEAFATLSADGGVLSLDFPLLEAHLRFARR